MSSIRSIPALMTFSDPRILPITPIMVFSSVTAL
jgi:hypothetical protein